MISLFLYFKSGLSVVIKQSHAPSMAQEIMESICCFKTRLFDSNGPFFDILRMDMINKGQ